jgi:hypothetical protein
MLYKVRTYGYDSTQGPHFVEERTVGSLKAARLYAHDVLKAHEIVTTNDCYHRDVGRCWSVDIALYVKGQDPDKQSPLIEVVLPEIYIVPSVGELGYTP